MMRNLRLWVTVLLVVAIVTSSGGCAAGQSSLSETVTYEPLFSEVRWWDREMEDIERKIYLGTEDEPSESCMELYNKMKLLNLEMPLDSEERIVAYAWELARVREGCEKLEETEWYLTGIWHYPEGIWLAHYTLRSSVTKNADGTINIPYGSNLTFTIAENDGEILNEFVFPV